MRDAKTLDTLTLDTLVRNKAIDEARTEIKLAWGSMWKALKLPRSTENTMLMERWTEKSMDFNSKRIGDEAVEKFLERYEQMASDIRFLEDQVM